MLRTFRVPIGKGYEGSLHAIAMSPDGAMIAAAGYTGNWDGSWCIYIFETATGRLLKRLTPLPDRTLHMSFSKDGRFLVASLKAGAGMRVYRTDDYSLAGQHGPYGSDSVWAEFDADGRLLTTSLDGYLRLYRNDFSLLHEKKAPGGEWIVGASFSPDGERIAVGYADTSRVDILSAQNLELLTSANTRDVKRGSFARVAWSVDGRFLYAGGDFERGGRNPIRRWPAKSPRRFSDIPAASNVVMQIIPLNDGSIASSGRDPIVGVINKANREVFTRGPSTGDFREALESLLVSDDGTVVEFGFEAWGQRPFRFSVARRELLVDPEEPDDSLSMPVLETGALEFSDWRDSYTPHVNERTIPMLPHEASRALAVLPGGQHFILGTSWRLIRFGPNGEIGWQFRTPASVWTLNVTPNGKLVVAGLGDGTIRWYRAESGRDLLALFAHADGRRWVAWTASGYYMASPDGDSLIGWHANRGRDKAADFFPARRLRDTFYRPDVVTRILHTLDEEKALRRADAGDADTGPTRSVAELLPPVITILSPPGETTVSDPQVTIGYALRAPSGEPVTAIRVLADGRPWRRFDQKPIRVEGDEYVGSIQVTIPRRDVEISLIAENDQAVSDPSTVSFNWVGQRSEQLAHMPKLYVLAVGISEYANPRLKLSFAATDAFDFVRVLRSQKGLAYGEVEAMVLTDHEATLANVRRGLAWIRKRADIWDVAVIFLAGHGVDDADGSYYYLPHGDDPRHLATTGLPYTDIRATLATIPALTLFFIDTCHAGDVLGRPGQPSTDTNRLINDLSSAENGVVVFASSKGSEVSYENAAWENGAFTEAMVEGFHGDAAIAGRDYITIGMLNVYVSERVKDLTSGKQTPTMALPSLIPDLHVALRQ